MLHNFLASSSSDFSRYTACLLLPIPFPAHPPSYFTHRACSSDVGAVPKQNGEDFFASIKGSNVYGGGVGKALEEGGMKKKQLP